MGLPAARLGDPTVHGGVIVIGCPTVLIGGQPAARIGDNHVCPMVTGIVPHVGGPLVLGAFTVLTGAVPQSRQTDLLVCVGPPDSVLLGAVTVLVGMAGGGGGFGAMMSGLAAGLANFLGGYPKAVLDPATGQIVTQYNSQITITGSPQYQATVVSDLNTFLATPTGKGWSKAFSSTSSHITIQPIPADQQQNNGFTDTTNDALIQVNPDGTEKRGAGSDSTISYNPSYTGYYRGEDGNTYESPPHETLGHEMIHGLHNANGENRVNIPDTEPNGDNEEEARTIGVHGFDDEDVSERTMSEDARGPGSARPDHNSMTKDVFQDSTGTWHDVSYDDDGNQTDTIIPAPANAPPNH